MPDDEREFPGFVAVSALLTGRGTAELRATGRVRRYHQAIIDRVGRAAVGRFLDDLAAAGGNPEAIVDEGSREVARAIVALWRSSE